MIVKPFCDYKGCRAKAVKILSTRDVKTDSVNLWQRCNDHYIMLIVELAGQATNGQIYG